MLAKDLAAGNLHTGHIYIYIYIYYFMMSVFPRSLLYGIIFNNLNGLVADDAITAKKEH